MAEGLVRRILYVDMYSMVDGVYESVHADMLGAEFDYQTRGSYILHGIPFEKAVEREGAVFDDYNILITDLSFGIFRRSIPGPNTRSPGAYLAEIVKRRNPDMLLLLNTGAGKIRPDEAELFDHIFYGAKDTFEDIVRWVVEHDRKN